MTLYLLGGLQLIVVRFKINKNSSGVSSEIPWSFGRSSKRKKKSKIWNKDVKRRWQSSSSSSSEIVARILCALLSAFLVKMPLKSINMISGLKYFQIKERRMKRKSLGRILASTWQLVLLLPANLNWFFRMVVDQVYHFQFLGISRSSSSSKVAIF